MKNLSKSFDAHLKEHIIVLDNPSFHSNYLCKTALKDMKACALFMAPYSSDQPHIISL